MSWLVTDTKYGTVVPGCTGPLVCGDTAIVEGRRIQESAITSSLDTAFVETQTSSITPWKLWHLPGAMTLRTIDLEAQKARAWDDARAAVDRYAPAFGAHLLEIECRNHLIADPRRMMKAEFIRVMDELRNRARLVIGVRRAAALHDEVATLAAGLIDAGI